MQLLNSVQFVSFTTSTGGANKQESGTSTVRHVRVFDVTGSLVGTLMDHSGAMVQNAAVTATESSTNVARETKTNDSGNYSFPDLPPGTYTVTVVAQGFKQDTHQNIAVLTNSTQRVESIWFLARFTESILVTTAPPLLQTDRADISTKIEQQQVADLLEFVITHYLDGDVEHLTERFLCAEVFGRPLDYETGTDSVVRVRAADVRRRLLEHHSKHEPVEGIVIEFPAGSYVPEFRWAFATYPEPITEDYALITRIIDPDQERVRISIGGLNMFGTQAAGEFLTDESSFSLFARNAPKAGEKRNLQIVLAMQVSSGKAVNPRIAAMNVW